MHRIEGDGYVLESGFQRFKNRDLPTYVGTVFNDEWGNAVQEEIANVLVEAGVTIATSAAADRTAGWAQLKEAIFDSEALGTLALADDAVTTDKINDCDLSKLSWDNAAGGTDITYASGGTTQELQFNLGGATFTLNNTVSDYQFTANYSYDDFTLIRAENSGTELTGQLFANAADGSALLSGTGWSDYGDSDYEAFQLKTDIGLTHYNAVSGSVVEAGKLTYDGLRFTENSLDTMRPLKFAIFDMDGDSWSAGSPSYAYHTQTVMSYTTAQPIMAQFRYRNTTSGDVRILSATGTGDDYNIRFDQNGAYWRARVQVPTNISTGHDQRWLCVWYGKV